MTRALLVIDVQQGLCEGEGAAWDCANVIARINRVAAHARASGVPVVFIQHEDATELVLGSRAWELADGLLDEPGDLRVRKTTPDSFLRTDLQALLSARGVSELIVCGMHSEFCVDTTTRRALPLGYPVTLVDTAGLRESEDRIEQEGVRRALERAALWLETRQDREVLQAGARRLALTIARALQLALLCR